MQSFLDAISPAFSRYTSLSPYHWDPFPCSIRNSILLHPSERAIRNKLFFMVSMILLVTFILRFISAFGIRFHNVSLRFLLEYVSSAESTVLFSLLFITHTLDPHVAIPSTIVLKTYFLFCLTLFHRTGLSFLLLFWLPLLFFSECLAHLGCF